MAGTETIDWVLYDFDKGSHAAGVEVTFFDAAEPSATNNQQDTNMQVASQLPSGEKFTIHKIGVLFDWPAAVANATEETDALDQATLELVVASKRMFIAPVQILLAPNQFPAVDIASGASCGNIGNNWFELKHPITIPGGTSFKVVLTQGITDTTADITFGVCLVGELTRPA